MAKTGIHFKPCNVGSVEAHNERTQSYLDGVLRSGREFYFFPDLTHLNCSYVNPRYNSLNCADIFEKQKELYTRKTGQKPNLQDRVVLNAKTGRERIISGWSPIREGVCPINEDTKLEDFKPFIDWCSSHGLNVIRIDLHFDEGYENKKGERTFNRHAHIVVDWLNWQTAKTAKLDASKMSEAQDIIAMALDMERGKAKAETGTKHLSPSEFREQAAEEHAIQLEQENRKLKEINTGLAAKVKDTWQYKGRAEQAEADLEAIRKDFSDYKDSTDQILAEAKKTAEIAEKRANLAENKVASLTDEVNRLKVAANHWMTKYNNLQNPESQKRGTKR